MAAQTRGRGRPAKHAGPPPRPDPDERRKYERSGGGGPTEPTRKTPFTKVPRLTGHIPSDAIRRLVDGEPPRRWPGLTANDYADLRCLSSLRMAGLGKAQTPWQPTPFEDMPDTTPRRIIYQGPERTEDMATTNENGATPPKSAATLRNYLDAAELYEQETKSAERLRDELAAAAMSWEAARMGVVDAITALGSNPLNLDVSGQAPAAVVTALDVKDEVDHIVEAGDWAARMRAETKKKDEEKTKKDAIDAAVATALVKDKDEDEAKAPAPTTTTTPTRHVWTGATPVVEEKVHDRPEPSARTGGRGTASAAAHVALKPGEKLTKNGRLPKGGAEARILEAVAFNPWAHINQIAEESGINLRVVSVTVGKLAEKGLMVRESRPYKKGPGRKHTRKSGYHYHLTEAGEARVGVGS